MSKLTLRDSQLLMAQYLRDPGSAATPAGVEQRRLNIYRRLVYNNIENFISSGFPVLRSLYSEVQWQALVHAFIVGHRCHTPYFLEISQEFLQYLLHEHEESESDPPFLAELAHYEWVELALDVAEAEPPRPLHDADVLSAIPRLSALAWLLSYQYPVHRIGPTFRPAVSESPTYLVVYRDRTEQVRFMELNAASARLVELTRDNSTATGATLLKLLAAESGMDAGRIMDFGAAQLAEFAECSILGLSESVDDAAFIG